MVRRCCSDLSGYLRASFCCGHSVGCRGHDRTTPLPTAPRVVHFAQTYSAMRDRFFACDESMPTLKNDKFREYTRYAEYCLNMVASTRDQELRCAQREMAAEWLRLADVARRPRKFKQMQMG